MKDNLAKLWNKVAEAGGVAFGCLFIAAIFTGIVGGIIFLFKWLWSLSFVKNAVYQTSDFISENSTILEYIFVGGFLLYLCICIVVGIISFIHDNKYSIVNGIKTAWDWFLKCLCVLLLIAFCLFCLHQCFQNSPDIEPQLYVHRM